MKRIIPLLIFSLLVSLVSADDVIHTVKKGDTLYSISRIYGVSVDTLISYNDLSDPSRLKAGMTLKIPNHYSIEKGDTLYGVARKFGTTVEALRTLNGFTIDHLLKVGEVICLPSPSSPVNDIIQSVNNGGPSAGTIGAITPSQQTSPDVTTVLWPHSGTREILTGKLEGIAFIGKPGDPVVSISSGQVVLVQPFRGYGKLICVQSDANYIYAYAGNEQTLVRVGDIVYPGMEIGRLGINPHTHEAKLFFTVSKDGKIIDPEIAPRG